MNTESPILENCLVLEGRFEPRQYTIQCVQESGIFRNVQSAESLKINCLQKSK